MKKDEFYKIKIEHILSLILKDGIEGLYRNTGYYTIREAFINDVIVNPEDYGLIRNAVASFLFKKGKEPSHTNKLSKRNKLSLEMCLMDLAPTEGDYVNVGYVYFRKRDKIDQFVFSRFLLCTVLKKGS